MKAFGLFIANIFFFISNSVAQDIITKINKEQIKAIVNEVTPSEIKFKKFDNTNGPSYTLSVSDVYIIQYKNGSVDSFNIKNNALPLPQNLSNKVAKNPFNNYKNVVIKNARDYAPPSQFLEITKNHTGHFDPVFNPATNEVITDGATFNFLASEFRSKYYYYSIDGAEISFLEPEALQTIYTTPTVLNNGKILATQKRNIWEITKEKTITKIFKKKDAIYGGIIHFKDDAFIIGYEDGTLFSYNTNYTQRAAYFSVNQRLGLKEYYGFTSGKIVNDTSFLFCDRGGYVYYLNRNLIEIIPPIKTDGVILGEPLINLDSNSFFISTYAGSLIKYDFKGKIINSFKIPTDKIMYSSAMESKTGNLVVATTNGTVVFLDNDLNELKRIVRAKCYSAPVCLTNGLFLVCAEDKLAVFYTPLGDEVGKVALTFSCECKPLQLPNGRIVLTCPKEEGFTMDKIYFIEPPK